MNTNLTGHLKESVIMENICRFCCVKCTISTAMSLSIITKMLKKRKNAIDEQDQHWEYNELTKK